MELAASTPRTFEMELPTPTIGAVLKGIDLGHELGDDCRAELQRALAEREVLFLPTQGIEPDDQLRFASVFGEPRRVAAFFPRLPESEYVEVLEGTGESIGTDVWHTDLSWRERPAVATCVHARALPRVGGDTLWASMTAAYNALSPAVRDVVEDLEAEHSWEKSIVDYVRRGDDGDDRYRQQRATFPPVRHRVIQTHPVTGKKIVFVNELFTTAIRGVPREEGGALLSLLTGLARVPEHQVRYRWDQNAVVIWDNRSVQHYAVTDYAPSYRRLHRVTLDDPSTSFAAVSH